MARPTEIKSPDKLAFRKKFIAPNGNKYLVSKVKKHYKSDPWNKVGCIFEDALRDYGDEIQYIDNVLLGKLQPKPRIVKISNQFEKSHMPHVPKNKVYPFLQQMWQMNVDILGFDQPTFIKHIQKSYLLPLNDKQVSDYLDIYKKRLDLKSSR